MDSEPLSDPQARLRETADEFIRLRGALQQAETLPVVSVSAVSKARLAALHKRAAAIQSTIENVGKMIDGARRWFADTFGMKMESQVPLANPAIEGTIQTSIAAMNFFMRDAKAELNRIVAQHRAFESAPKEKQVQMLSGLGAQSVPAQAPVSKKWLWAGALALGAFLLIKEYGHGES